MAAEKGHSMAMYNLGLLYFNQSGMDLRATKDTEFNFEKEGLQMMERAAKHGLAEVKEISIYIDEIYRVYNFQ